MTEKIILTIRDKFIENLDEGLLLSDFNGHSKGPDYYFRKFVTIDTYYETGKNIRIPTKQDPIAYLTAVLIRQEQSDVIYKFVHQENISMVSGIDERQKKYDLFESGHCYKILDMEFRSYFFNYWEKKKEVLISILDNAPQYISAENISDNDRFFVNVGCRNNASIKVINRNQEYDFRKKNWNSIEATFADIFIITTQCFIRLSLGSNGVLDRTEHIIQKDIKKLNLTNNNILEVHFHGHYDPETIVLDDYKSAIQLQRHLTELRQTRPANSQKQK